MYTITFRCPDCGLVFSKKSKSPNPPDPRCPNLDCAKGLFSRPAQESTVEEPRVARAGLDFGAGADAPAVTGHTVTRAVEETARIVMEDQKLPNLGDIAKPGENTAPKLAPKLQAQADGFFGGAMGRGRNRLFNGPRVAKAAMAGAYAPGRVAGGRDPVAMAHAARTAPPVHIIADDRNIKGS